MRVQTPTSPEPGADAVPPPHESSLAVTQRTLRVAVGMAVLLPTVLVGALAWQGWKEAQREVDDQLVRASHVALEHAQKVFETNRQLLARVNDYVGMQTDDEIARREPLAHERLAAFVDGIPQVSSVNIVGTDGRLLASSRFFPAPHDLMLGSRGEIQMREMRPTEVQVSPPQAGRLNGDAVFNFTVRRPSRDGSFNGTVSLSMRPAYFYEQYERMNEGTQGLSITLFHADGSIITRTPQVQADARFSPNGALMRSIRQGHDQGGLTARSTIDGVDRTIRYGRVGDYPLYIAVGTSVSAWQTEWLHDTALLALYALVPSAVLVWALLIALQRLKNEELAWKKYHAEQAARQQVEAALRQSRKLEALGQVTGGISHDFNNILMVVGASTQLMKKLLAGRADVERPLAALERAVGSGRHLTRQLLAFARRQPLRPQAVDLRHRMQEFTDLLRASLGAKVQLQVRVAPTVPATVVDEAEMELALLNLALNARDAMGDSGGKLKISVDTVELDGSGLDSLQGRFVEIAFEDNGKGIARDDLAKVFEPFWTSKPAGQGTGLGLAQVHGFCKQAGGGVYIESSLGVGTTVTLLLPAVNDPEGTQPPPLAEQTLRQASGRLLLVEDNVEVAQSTQALLEAMGYEVQLSPSGEEALQRLRGGLLCDVVLSDMFMPGSVSGLALAQALRREQPTLPVLLMTGYTPELEAARREGFAVIAKPFDADALQVALEEVRRPLSSAT